MAGSTLLDQFVWSPAGRPQLLDSEVEIASVRTNGLSIGDEVVHDHIRGHLIVTNLRLLYYVEGGSPRSRQENCQHSLLLRRVENIHVEKPSGILGALKRSKKSFLRVLVTLRNDDGPQTSSMLARVEVSYVVKDETIDEFAARCQQACSKRAWLNSTSSRPSITASKTGMSGLKQAYESKAKAVDVSLDAAFTTLQGLMSEAGQLVKLAQDLTETLQREQTKATSASGAENSAEAAKREEESEELHTMLMNLGVSSLSVSSPLASKRGGNMKRFYQELSRHVCDFLHPILSKRGESPMLTLTDVYCLYNRARGLDLISPDDLYRACLEFSALRLPLQLRHLPGSEVLVVELRSLDQKTTSAVTEYIRDYVDERVAGGAHAHDIAKSLKLSLIVVRAELAAMVTAGVVVRDESAEGVKYFPNVYFRV